MVRSVLSQVGSILPSELPSPVVSSNRALWKLRVLRALLWPCQSHIPVFVPRAGVSAVDVVLSEKTTLGLARGLRN